MIIEQESVVALTYDLYTGKDNEEVFVEQASADNPLVFLYGVGMMLPKFEENLQGLNVGDKYDFKLSALDGYGEKDENAIAGLPIDMFKDGELPKPGAILPLQNDEGHQFQARVVEITEISVTVDLNHPMAGEDLHFKGEIISVRKATADELSHGHAHGADGHSGH